MKDFIFYEAEPDQKALFDFEPTMFHRVSHLQLQKSEGWRWYYAEDEKRKRVVASLYLNLSGESAVSSVRSPYGSVEGSEGVPPEVLFNFMIFVEDALKKRNVKSVRITCAPGVYMPKLHSLLSVYFPNLGYHTTAAALSAYLRPDSEFVSGISQTEKQALSKGALAGLHFRLIDIGKLEDVYTFIARCHHRKGYLMSMTFADLLTTVQKFEDRFILSGAFDQQTMVAASIAIRVSNNVLYNFYMDHDSAYDKISPVLILLEGLYSYCKGRSIRIMDLGTSALDGKPNFGLLSFKLRLGGLVTPKMTAEKFF